MEWKFSDNADYTLRGLRVAQKMVQKCYFNLHINKDGVIFFKRIIICVPAFWQFE